MPRTSVRTVLACFRPALILGLAGSTLLWNVASGGVTTPHPHTLPAGLTGTIQNIGPGGRDRLTAVTEAEAMIPERAAHKVPPPWLAQPGAAPPARRPAPGAPPAPPAPSVSTPPPSPVGGGAGQEFNLVNQDRAANGVRPLSWNDPLARVAQYRAQDMLNRGYFSHYDPANGQLAFLELFRTWGIGYSAAGENIAWSTDPSMAGINTMFMNSPEHRDNILNPAYGRDGVGVATDGTKVIVVEVFSN